jgi:phage terminase large subunit-like protein
MKTTGVRPKEKEGASMSRYEWYDGDGTRGPRALRHQVPPKGDWKVWMCLGDRGAGTTRAGAGYVVWEVLTRKATRIALVGSTFRHARSIMVQGDSGVDRATQGAVLGALDITGRYRWDNGATGTLFGADNIECMIGYRVDLCWVDRLADLDDHTQARVWVQLSWVLARGGRAVITGNSEISQTMLEIASRPDCVHTFATTSANRANLPEGYMEMLKGLRGPNPAAVARYCPVWSGE